MEYRRYLKNISVIVESDQVKGLPLPPIQKPYPDDASLIDLISPNEFTIGNIPLLKAINNRESRRKYTDEALTLEELSFLLWSTQGVKELVRQDLLTKRTVPSGGCMHPFETYLLINRVESIPPGLYRYIAVGHKLLPLKTNDPSLAEKLGEVNNGQTFVGKGAVVFIWSTRPYRTEWRYADDSLKDILMSVGHICQNLYLACEAINAGTCAVVAYQQDQLDEFIGVDGNDEIALYVAPVGKI
ncbi:MAG TPA: SagB/ThcOx family dehydrogenase [Candidatus Bathyarchaeia archaeon]|nr:SagB/ThcOx family dehydrogenase [Candidatus Bathyarchaeia archaeon]